MLSKLNYSEVEQNYGFEKNLFITTPIYYVNGRPHLGHLYTSVAADILARFEIMQGKQVFASFGTDEHGQKVEAAALKNGQSPKDFVDIAHVAFKDMLDAASIEYNCFVRTTDDMHKKTAEHLWNEIFERGFIYEGHYEGWYSKTDEAYYKEEDVVNEKSIETGSAVEWMKEPCLFFALSKMRDKLHEHYEKNPDMIKPRSKYAEVMGLLRSDLPDLAISRSRFSWGIPIPDRPEQVMYVWIDALANYLTVLGYPRNTEYSKWWKNSVHIIGKDILKFHAIYWPAFLLAADLEPPKRIFAHGWWNVDNQKMSKSIGNVIDPFQLIQTYGVDSVRYFLFREINFGNDGTFSHQAIQHMINVELANELGNLIQRILMLCYNKFGRTIEYSASNNEMNEANEIEILKTWDDALHSSIAAMQDQDISKYVNTCRAAVIETNQYIDIVKPWAMKPSEENSTHILGVLCLCIQRIAILYAPIIPNKCREVARMIGLNCFIVNDQNWNYHKSFLLRKPTAIFMRMIMP